MKKFKLYFDKDKEGKWLNEMAGQGWMLVNYKAGFYSFVPCTPGEWVYDIDLNDQVLSLSKEYQDFLADAHIEIVCRWGVWFIAKRKSKYGSLELYTDKASKIEQYKRIRNVFKIGCVIELLCMYVELFLFYFDPQWSVALCALILFLMFLILARALMMTNKKIDALENREYDPKSNMYLVIGLLITSVFLLLQDSIPEGIYSCGLIVGIVLECVGLFYGRIHKVN